jgi:hypothetical protein
MQLDSFELRHCAYAFFGHLSDLLGNDFAVLLEPVVRVRVVRG